MSEPRAQRGWALITGGARRIGAALALAAARAGYDLAIHVRSNPAAAAEVVAGVEALGRRVRVIPGELADPATPRALFDALEGHDVTLLVNNASIFEEDAIATIDPGAMARTLAINLTAPVLLAQAFAAARPTGAAGLIVNLLDQRVLRPTPQFFTYTLSKAALWTATLTLAQALAPGIRVNAIGPGPTLPSAAKGEAAFAAESAAVPLGRGPTPADMGAALAYLIDARGVTGQLICVDGGQHLA